MKKSKYSPEVIERSVRLVMEAKGEYDSQWAAIESIAGKIGCTAETLRRWVRQHETDTNAVKLSHLVVVNEAGRC